ncbi:M48 metallopeptidase family protein [Arthrobacter sp. A5]|uniref:M48 metallopeptidase family protein n=1 Tax=Arthrobacter sp. A5 TaxID=576926 RepID=UPI003DA9170F
MSSDRTPVPHLTAGGAPVLVRRSARRRRTVAAFWEGGTAVVAIPAHFSLAQERQWVAKMLAKLDAKGYAPGAPGEAGNGTFEKRRGGSDGELMARAAELSGRYLEGKAIPATVRWVTNQNSRWGSATPAERTIRLSDKVRGMPGWVVDYVLLHELSHLLVASHGPAFWALLQGYPQLERAKAFLDGVAYATSRGLQPGGTGDEGEACTESGGDG